VKLSSVAAGAGRHRAHAALIKPHFAAPQLHVRSRAVTRFGFYSLVGRSSGDTLRSVVFRRSWGRDLYGCLWRGRPGDIVFPDFPATPLKESLIEMGIGAGIIAVGFFARRYARRLRWADS